MAGMILIAGIIVGEHDLGGVHSGRNMTVVAIVIGHFSIIIGLCWFRVQNLCK